MGCHGKSRNNRVFSRRCISPDMLMEVTSSQINDLNPPTSALSLPLLCDQMISPQVILPDQLTWERFSLYTDVAWDPSTELIGVGCLLFNGENQLVVVGSFAIGPSASVLIAEMLAILTGVSQSGCQDRRVRVFSNSQAAIEGIKDVASCPYVIKPIRHDILLFIENIPLLK
ncbi:hypothetical protein Sjap_007768 [Stephania japonica]|uniref:RNase H type-1 domain-containing protein n=1 Tax=Stephania japonica TaxID=461633 RepID=A0AAP0JNM3_9MAGN